MTPDDEPTQVVPSSGDAAQLIGNRIQLVLAFNLFLQTYNQHQRKDLVEKVLTSEESFGAAVEDFTDILDLIGFEVASETGDGPYSPGGYL